MTNELKQMLKELGDNHKLTFDWYVSFKTQLKVDLLLAEQKGYERCSEERLKQLDEVFTK